MQLEGVGRGDVNGLGTTIVASPSFPMTQPLIQMGAAPGPNFGIQIANLTVNCSYRASAGILNLYAEEQSFASNILMTNCNRDGLLISGGGAQNSGPFTNLEIYPGGGTYLTANTRCIKIDNVISFRGISGATCNAGTLATTQPGVGIQINGDGRYSDLHVENVKTGIVLGSNAMAADSTIIENAEFGPNVNTGVFISNAPGINNENISLFGLSCVGCYTILNDGMKGNKIQDSTLGYYLLGNGAGSGKSVLTSAYGIAERSYGSFTSTSALVGPGIGTSFGTLSVQDATPTGATSAVIVAGMGQGFVNLQEWRDQNNTTMSFVAPDGVVHAPGFQPIQAQPAEPCTWELRGRLDYVEVDRNGHIRACVAVGGGAAYQWVNLNN